MTVSFLWIILCSYFVVRLKRMCGILLITADFGYNFVVFFCCCLFILLTLAFRLVWIGAKQLDEQYKWSAARYRQRERETSTGKICFIHSISQQECDQAKHHLNQNVAAEWCVGADGGMATDYAIRCENTINISYEIMLWRSLLSRMHNVI